MKNYEDSTESRLWNEDLAPVESGRRTWTKWNIAALWIGMAVCIPTYTLASGLIGQGMNWSQAVLPALMPVRMTMSFTDCTCDTR